MIAWSSRSLEQKAADASSPLLCSLCPGQMACRIQVSSDSAQVGPQKHSQDRTNDLCLICVSGSKA